MTDDRRDATPPRTVEGRVARLAGGEQEERTDPMVALSTRVPMSLRKRVRRTCFDVDVDVQDAVAEGLKMWLAKNER